MATQNITRSLRLVLSSIVVCAKSLGLTLSLASKKTFTCSKSKVEALEKGVKYVQC